MTRAKFEISWGTMWQVFLFALLVWVLIVAQNIILGLFLALVISSGLEVVVSFLERNRIPRTLGVVVLFLTIALLLAVAIYFVAPLLIQEMNDVFATTKNSPLGLLFEEVLSARTTQSFTEILNNVTGEFFAGQVTPFSTLANMFGGVGLAVAVVVISFYLSLSRDGVERFIRLVFPKTHEKTALRIYERSRVKVGWWFQGQIVLSIIVGTLTWGALYFLGVPHAFLVGVLAGLFEIVPFVGPIVSGGIAVLFSLNVSSSLALYTLVAMLVLQQLENHVLAPLIMKKVVDLHPVIVIVALLVGFEVGGILGMLLAVPVAAVLQEVIEDTSLKKREPAVTME